MASDHGFIKRHIDSSFDSSLDTGVKVTMLWVLNKGDEVDSKYGEVVVYRGDKEEVVTLKSNRLVIIKSRAVEWEIRNCQAKTFIIVAKISGPSVPGLA